MYPPNDVLILKKKKRIINLSDSPMKLNFANSTHMNQKENDF